MTHQERDCLSSIVAAKELLKALRDKLCEAMIALPDGHPIKAEIRSRWLVLFSDVPIEVKSGDGTYFDLMVLAERLVKESK